MISFTRKWLWLFLSTALFSCNSMREEVVPEELTSQSTKLVVDCFISPQDSLLTAKVSRSRPILDDQSAKTVDISDATVLLSDGSNSVKLVYNAQQGVYSIKPQKLVVREGGTYTLTVSTPDGKQVLATTTVPKAVALKSMQVDSSLQAGAVQKDFRVIGNWQAGADTYFRVKGSYRGIRYGAPANASFENPQVIPFLMATNSLGLVECPAKAASLLASASLGDGSFKKLYCSTQITMNLLHVDAAYYAYHVALDQQLQVSSNPFAEPVTLPTNIQGGLGCFGSYNQTTLSTVIK
ncbi:MULTISPECIES: DUF4249 domain-containing protein [unclassified Spirosoma]|uniref:DUF4249 domain-containing protein n=1 Tax=unclassified Spirosoma TaxID=2621999 RepID=UPI001AC70D75|nr:MULTISPECIES: DUF4249 domain-containing protein [unclassified Spirosoma]MBN8822932.1 DUF4249 domain-containing protein [Spirosoma sp.]